MHFHVDYVVSNPQDQYYANYGEFDPQNQQYVNYPGQFYVPHVMMQPGFNQMQEHFIGERVYQSNRGGSRGGHRGRGYRGHSYSMNRGERNFRTRQSHSAENKTQNETELQNKMEAYLKNEKCVGKTDSGDSNIESDSKERGDNQSRNGTSSMYHAQQSENDNATKQNYYNENYNSSLGTPDELFVLTDNDNEKENSGNSNSSSNFDRLSESRGARSKFDSNNSRKNYRRYDGNSSPYDSMSTRQYGRTEQRRNEHLDSKDKVQRGPNKSNYKHTASNYYKQRWSEPNFTADKRGYDYVQTHTKPANTTSEYDEQNLEYFNPNREHYEEKKHLYSRKIEVDKPRSGRYKKPHDAYQYSKQDKQQRESQFDTRGDKSYMDNTYSSDFSRKSNFVSMNKKTNNNKEMTSHNAPLQTNAQSAKGHKSPKRPQMMRTLSGKLDESQRAVLIEQLTLGKYECMVCCEIVRGQNAVWSCVNCFHVFHLRCVKQWARSPAARVEGTDRGWRCPACQNVCDKFPNQYRCFCGKVRDPEWNRMEIPHSCGEVCKKTRGEQCPHPCISLCHPGPCPPCNASVKRSCNCGKTSQTLKCSSTDVLRCENVCQKQLNCGRHNCNQVCHAGSCSPCEETIIQECYGEHESREVICGSKESFTECFSCEKPCNKVLSCGNHRCEELCHRGDCEDCERLPSKITKCPCGATDLKDLSTELRKSCLDAIPHCGEVCGKLLTCGPPENLHTCKKQCHEGMCGPCDGMTLLTCRCGTMEKKFACTEISQFEDNPFCCDRRCNKKRSCGRHKCGQLCCLKEEHNCDLICGKKLSCGLHKCEELCHRGNCPPCLMASFDELTCHCGAEILYPPIPCGTRPPECKQMCIREHSCQHPVLHKCHSEDVCPPCTALTEKWCMGQHELRKNIACHLNNISCGLPCQKELPCKQHKCIKICHSDACQEEGEQCQQLCLYKRTNCEHACGMPCHNGQACPDVPCKSEITIKCPCGNKTAKVPCNKGSSGDTSAYQWRSMASSLQMGQNVDITQLTNSKKAGIRQLECDAECAVVERNRRVALALEIKNPDLQGKLGSPTYSDFLKEFAKNNLHIVSSVEKSLSELVQNAKKAKQAHRSHSFPSMNREQRRLIYELAECYGCEAQSYDYEPKKNVVATAYKEKCWLPNVTLTTHVQRELHPKAPQPIPHYYNEGNIRQSVQASKQSFEVLQDKPIKKHFRKNDSTATSQVTKKSEPVIDYFDFSTK